MKEFIRVPVEQLVDTNAFSGMALTEWQSVGIRVGLTQSSQSRVTIF